MRAVIQSKKSKEFQRDMSSFNQGDLFTFLSVQYFSSAHVISKNFFSFSRLSLNGERFIPRFLRRRSNFFG